MVEHRSSDKRSGGNQATRTYRQGDEAARPTVVSQALRKDGGAGGISGTGQAFPHHGFDDDAGRSTTANPIGEEASLPQPEIGSTYQAGGTHLNRDRQEQTRKDRFAGSTASRRRAGPDAAPSAPARRG
jgi:hypothetical protein